MSFFLQERKFLHLQFAQRIAPILKMKKSSNFNHFTYSILASSISSPGRQHESKFCDDRALRRDFLTRRLDLLECRSRKPRKQEEAGAMEIFQEPRREKRKNTRVFLELYCCSCSYHA